jgi:hypothetical protein
MIDGGRIMDVGCLGSSELRHTELPHMNSHVMVVSYVDICQWTEKLCVNFHLSSEVKWLSKWCLACPYN